MESFLCAFGFGVYYLDDSHTPRRVCGSTTGMPLVEGLHTGCDMNWKALEMIRTGEYDPAAEK